jgi:hypothetical protein
VRSQSRGLRQGRGDAHRTPQIRQIEDVAKFSAMPSAASKGKGKKIRQIGSGVLQALEHASERLVARLAWRDGTAACDNPTDPS